MANFVALYSLKLRGVIKDETKSIGVNSLKWSLQPRTIYLDDEQMAKKRGHPGPGTYEE